MCILICLKHKQIIFLHWKSVVPIHLLIIKCIRATMLTNSPRQIHWAQIMSALYHYISQHNRLIDCCKMPLQSVTLGLNFMCLNIHVKNQVAQLYWIGIHYLNHQVHQSHNHVNNPNQPKYMGQNHDDTWSLYINMKVNHGQSWSIMVKPWPR